MSYKHFLNSHWSGCRLLAETHDHCRRRPVKLYAVPGNFDYVGVTDGTDAWVAPANVQGGVFGVDVRELLRRLQAGEDVQSVATGRQRVRVHAPPAQIQQQPSQQQPRSRVRVQLHS